MTHFPLRASISEGGELPQLGKVKDSGIVLVPASDLEILKKATEELFFNVPNFELSDDSSGRITDRAIDLNFLEENSVEDQIKQSLDKFKIHIQSQMFILTTGLERFQKLTVLITT